MYTKLSVVPFTPDLLPEVRPLVEASLRARLDDGLSGLYVSDSRLVSFHSNRLASLANSEKPAYLLRDGSLPIALLAIDGPTWHSRFAGSHIGRIGVFYPLSEDFGALLAVTAWIREKGEEMGFEMLSGRCAAELHALIAAMSENGWRHVGTSLKYILQPIPPHDHPRPLPPGLVIRKAKANDLEALQKIMADSHKHSHFFNEPSWKQGAGQSIFAEWLRKSLQNEAVYFPVAEYENQVAGFVSLMLAQNIKDYLGYPIGILDFICVDQQVQGAGLGRALMQEALKWAGSQTPVLELRTMLDNHHASAWYQRLGFRLAGADHHFHAWLKGASG